MLDNLIHISKEYIKEKNEFKLKNGLNVIRYNIKDIKQKGCLIRINAGSFFEKVDGLAHLIEHCIFYKDDFVNNVYKLNGYLSASTIQTHTSYHFYINDNKEDKINFEYCLKEFSKCFYDYTIDDKMIEREINTVDVEFKSKKEGSDFQFVEDNLGKTSHGLKQSLDIKNIKEKIYDFINYFYYAENMTLYIFDDDDLNNVKKKIKCFENIKQNNKDWLSKSEYTSYNRIHKNYDNINHIFKSNQLYKTSNLYNLKHLTLIFSINNNNFNKNAFSYLKYLINNHFITYLINQKLIIEGSFYYSYTIYKYDIIYITFNLTKKGYNNYNSIISSFYDFLNYIINNFNNLNYSKFKDLSLIKNYFITNNLKRIMEFIRRSKNEYLKSNYDCDDNFNKEILETFIKQLNINYALIIINNPEYKNLNNKFKYYDLKYKKEEYKFKKEKQVDFNIDFSINTINNDLTFKSFKEFKINKVKKDYNKLIEKDKYKIYIDDNIEDRKCNIELKINLDNLNLDNYIYTNIYSYIINEYLNDIFRNDRLYGLSFEIKLEDNYLLIIINSILNDIYKILISVIKYLLEFKINEEILNKYKLIYKKILNEINNNHHKFAFSFVIKEYLKKSINKNYYTIEEQLNKIDNIKYNKSYKLKMYELESIINCKDKDMIDNIKKILISFSENKLLNKKNKKEIEYDINKLNNKVININKNCIQMLIYSKIQLFNFSKYDNLTKYKYKLIFKIIISLLHPTYWKYMNDNSYPGYGGHISLLNLFDNIYIMMYPSQVNKGININDYNYIKQSIENYRRDFIINFIKNNITNNTIKDCINNIIDKNFKNISFEIFEDKNYYSTNIKLIKSITKKDLLNFINDFILNDETINCIFNINNHLI